MNQDIKAQWLKALRSGEYEQGRQQLRKGDAMCCLGVLCELNSKTGEGKWIRGGDDIYDYQIDGIERDDVLPPGVCDWAGVNANPLIGDAWLSQYNDGDINANLEPHTFAEIADLIEQYL